MWMRRLMGISLVPYVVSALQEVYDPEAGLNVVDLGLIYDIQELRGDVRVSMTMTSRRCPLESYITGMVQAVISENVPGVRSVRLDMVWDPPWSPQMISDKARARLLHHY